MIDFVDNDIALMSPKTVLTLIYFIYFSDPNTECSMLHLNHFEERSSLSSFTIRV